MAKKGISEIKKDNRKVLVNLSPIAQAITKILASQVYGGVSISDLVRILLNEKAKAMNLEAEIRKELNQVDPMLCRLGTKLLY